jgi:hypothetical protein
MTVQNSPGTRSPCVCCGYLTAGTLGSSDICGICFWEDDLVQLRFPEMAGGANNPSLIEAQRNYAEVFACEQRLVRYVRPAVSADVREPGWRPIDSRDIENVVGSGWPTDLTTLYWWRPSFRCFSREG